MYFAKQSLASLKKKVYATARRGWLICGEANSLALSLTNIRQYSKKVHLQFNLFARKVAGNQTILNNTKPFLMSI